MSPVSRRLYGHVVLLTLLGIFCLVPVARAQRYDNIALGPKGQPIAGASVAVCTQPATTTTTPCSPLATLYTNTSLSVTAPNPTTTDALGNYHFYAATGTLYTIQIYGPSITTPFVMPDQLVNGTTPGSISGCTNGNIVVATGTTSGGCSPAIPAANVLHPHGPDPWFDVTNSAYGSCPFNGTGDDTSCWNAALAAQAATITANGGGGGHIYLPCGVSSVVSSSLSFNNNSSTNGYTLIDLCGTLYPTGTITIAHGFKGIVGHPQGTGAIPAADHIPYTLINTSKFVGTGPIIQVAATTDNNSSYFDSIGIVNCPGDCLLLGASGSGTEPVFATIRNSTFKTSLTSTGYCVDSFLGFGFDTFWSFCGGNGIQSTTGQVHFSDVFMSGGGFFLNAGPCGVGALATYVFDNIKTENLQSASPGLININTATSCPAQNIDIGPGIWMADNMGGGLYIVDHVGSDTSKVTVKLHGIGPFTGEATGVVGGANITYSADSDSGLFLSPGMFLQAQGDQNVFGICPGGTATTSIASTTCAAGGSTGSPLTSQIIAPIPSSTDGNIWQVMDRGNANGAVFGGCTSRTFGGSCGSSGTGHAYGLFWRDVSTGGFGVFRSEGITASAQRNWIFPDADTNVVGYNLAQNWTAMQTFVSPSTSSLSRTFYSGSGGLSVLGGQVGISDTGTANAWAGTTFLFNTGSSATGLILTASAFPNIDFGLLPSGKVGVHTLDTASTTPACYGSQTMNTVSLSTEASCSGVPIIENCGATSGSTQACAKTVPTSPIVVFGDVTLNTATSQAITTLPFTAAADYSCSGSDLTTAAGTVSFPTYTSGAQVTIQETNGANTDHLRYMCVGF